MKPPIANLILATKTNIRLKKTKSISMAHKNPGLEPVIWPLALETWPLCLALATMVLASGLPLVIDWTFE